jgi:hypothetical protein
MDAAGIDIQVLSLTSPGVEQVDANEAMAIARESNEFVANAVSNNPMRLAGFAGIPSTLQKTSSPVADFRPVRSTGSEHSGSILGLSEVRPSVARASECTRMQHGPRERADCFRATESFPTRLPDDERSAFAIPRSPGARQPRL